MPRLFFNVTNFPADEDGMEFEDLPAGRVEALKAFGEMIHEAATNLHGPFEMQVSDEHGTVLLRLALTEEG